MALMTFGPLQGAPPTVGTAVLAMGAGVVGFAWIFLNVVVRKRRDFTWPKLLFVCTVLLFLTICGVMQLFQIR